MTWICQYTNTLTQSKKQKVGEKFFETSILLQGLTYIDKTR